VRDPKTNQPYVQTHGLTTQDANYNPQLNQSEATTNLLTESLTSGYYTDTTSQVTISRPALNQ